MPKIFLSLFLAVVTLPLSAQTDKVITQRKTLASAKVILINIDYLHKVFDITGTEMSQYKELPVPKTDDPYPWDQHGDYLLILKFPQGNRNNILVLNRKDL